MRRAENHDQAIVIVQLLKNGIKHDEQSNKQAAVMSQLRTQKKMLQQHKRRHEERLTKLKEAAKAYTTEKVGIDIVNMDDKERYQALMQLAYHMIDEDALKNLNRSAQEQEEDKETLKAVFAATWSLSRTRAAFGLICMI